MRRKGFALLAASSLLVMAVVPFGLAGATQGSLTTVSPASTFAFTTGFASSSNPGSNVDTFRIQDPDLNVHNALAGDCSTLKAGLTGKCMILGTGDAGTFSFGLDASITPAIAPVTAQDVQAGLGYIASVGAGGASITLQPTPADVPAGDVGVGAVNAAEWERVDVNGLTLDAADQAIATGAFSGASRIRVSVTDNGGDAVATATGVTLTIKGTSVNPVTLAQTANDTETLAAFAADSTGTATQTKTTAKYFLAAGLTFTTTGTATGSAGYRLRIQETRTLWAAFSYGKFNDTDNGAGTSGSPYAQTVKAASTSNTAGINITLFETETSVSPVAPSKNSSSNHYQLVVVNYNQWKAADDPDTGADNATTPKDSDVLLARGFALIDGSLLAQINTRKVASQPAACDTSSDAAFAADTDCYQFTDDTSIVRVIAALNHDNPAVDEDADGTLDEDTESTTIKGADWVANTWTGLGITSLNVATGAEVAAVNTAVLWKHLVQIVLAVINGDNVTVTYTDPSDGAVVKAVAVDLAAPAITGLFPAKNSFISTSSPTLKATVSDSGTGLRSVKVYLGAGDVACPGAMAPILNLDLSGVKPASFDVSQTQSGLAGTNTWCVVAEDMVYNTAETGKVVFTVDTVAPKMASAITGVGLKLTAGKTDEYEEFRDAQWVRVTMDEKVDPASVTASDFVVEGVGAPTEVLVVKKLKEVDLTSATDALGALQTDRRDLVYLKLASKLGAAATPKVTLSTSVADLAGNASPTGTTTGAFVTAADKIRPTLTIALNKTLGKAGDAITITVTADEALLGDVAGIKVGATCAAGAAVSTTGGGGTWTGTFTIAATGVLKACANGTDVVNNAAKEKSAEFQGDAMAPTVGFAFAANKKFETGDVTFLRVDFNDCGVTAICDATDAAKGEYAGDSHAKVSMKSSKLEVLDKAGGTVTSTVTLPTPQGTGNASYVFAAQNLAVGFYKLTATGTDEAGNDSAAGAIEFQMIERQPVEVAVVPGWNLLSLPERPIDPSIEKVLADPKTGVKMTTITQVFSLQGGKWLSASLNMGTGGSGPATWDTSGGLTTIQDGFAYFVRSTSYDSIKYMSAPFSAVATQPTYRLRAGWNGIGVTGKLATGVTEVAAKGYLASLGTKWTTLRVFNTADGTFATMYNDLALTTTGTWPSAAGTVKVGLGYFVYVTEDIVLAP